VGIVATKQPDLVLMDITLKGKMDGVEAVEAIQTHLDVPIVYLTAHSEHTVFDRAKFTQPYGYLTKPVSPKDVQHAVEMALYKHEMERKLKESEERFRQLAENVHEVFWITSPGKPREVIYLSPAHEVVWGRSREEVYNDPGSWIRSVHDEDQEKIRATYEEFCLGKGDYNVEYRINRPDGSTRWIWDKAFPIYDDDGTLNRVAGLAQDITQRKMEAERQKELVEEIKHFAYLVSHDLRAPLNSVRGFSTELKAGLDVLRPVIDRAMPALPDEERT
jgi:PAS domain S-box-containing protein